MDAALGHLVFSMKYDVIGDQEHLRLMLRYNVLLSLSLTCFLSHLYLSFILTCWSQSSRLQYLFVFLHNTPFSTPASNIHVMQWFLAFTHRGLPNRTIPYRVFSQMTWLLWKNFDRKRFSILTCRLSNEIQNLFSSSIADIRQLSGKAYPCCQRFPKKFSHQFHLQLNTASDICCFFYTFL